MAFREKSIQMVKPYFEELAKTYSGYVSENSPISFGQTYDASVDDYDLVVKAEDDFELGIRFSGDENKVRFIANAYFILLLNGKKYKICKHICSYTLNEDNVKSLVQKFIKVYQEEKQEKTNSDNEGDFKYGRD